MFPFIAIMMVWLFGIEGNCKNIIKHQELKLVLGNKSAGKGVVWDAIREFTHLFAVQGIG